MTNIRLTTPVEIGKSLRPIGFQSKIMMIGSCFADNIGHMMQKADFGITVNPFGTTYNPASLCEAIRRLESNEKFCADECTTIGAGDERICSFGHHTKRARTTVEEFLREANEALELAHEQWMQCDTLIATLGTAWCYKLNETNKVVNNCLKHPQREFERELLSVDEVCQNLENICQLAEGRQVILTVSPIRHMRDGAHGNALSKATLHIGIETVMNQRAEQVCYFPSYEIMMDELRDYRFYADDMSHPSGLAEQIIFDKFMEFALDPRQKTQLAENLKKAKQISHRPNIGVL